MIREISARPFLLLFFGVLLGINWPTVAWIFGVGAALGFVFKQKWLGVLCLGVFLAGFFVSLAQVEPMSQGRFSGVVQLTGFAEYRQGQTWVPIRKGILKLPGSVAVAAGEQWQITGEVTAAKTGVLRAESFVLRAPSAFSGLGQLRLEAINRLLDLYGERDGAWVSALTLNYASSLDRTDKNALITSGTYHLVSASGLHVWVVALFFHFIFVQIGMKRHHQIILVSMILACYCMATGFHPPTIRSALIWLLGSSAYLIKRSPDSVSALSLAGVLWLTFAPMDAFSPSFQLSYIVSGVLIIWFERHRSVRSESELWTGLSSSLVASMAAEPLGAWWFGRIIFIGPVANILVEFASAVVLVLGLLSLVPGVGFLAALCCRPLIWWMQAVLEFVSRTPSLVMAPKSVSPWLFVAYYSLLLMLIWGRPRRTAPEVSGRESRFEEHDA